MQINIFTRVAVLTCAFLPVFNHIAEAQGSPLALGQGKSAAQSPTPSGFKSLTGQEALIEAIDQEGRIGVYALDILSPDPKPQIISYGAISPRWSVKHQKILFFKDQSAQVCDRNGSIVVWKKDRTTGRFSNALRLQSSRIWWDYSGRANLIYDWPFSGPQLSRSIGLDEEHPTTARGSIGGFIDQITPIYKKGVDGKKGVESRDWLSCISAASISPKQDLLAAQVYPAMPYDMGKSASTIRLYKLFYALGHTDEAAWRQKQEANKAGFYIAGVVPQVEADSQTIGSPSASSIDVEPLFSPSGNYLSFNRIDTTSRAISPMVVEMSKPSVAVKVELPDVASVDISRFSPDLMAGWPTQAAFAWSSDEDTLWIVSGDEAMALVASRVGDTWKASVVCGFKVSLGRFSHYAVYKDWFCCTYADNPKRIYLFNRKTGEKQTRFVELPEGMQLRDIQW